MTSVTYSEFRGNLSHWLNLVEDDFEPVVVSRGKQRKSVVISWDEYSSLQETAYLMSTTNNQKHLEESIQQHKQGNLIPFTLAS